MANKYKMTTGSIVRHKRAFMRSCGMVTGWPVNGMVTELGHLGGKLLLTVTWSDGHENSILAANCELDPRFREENDNEYNSATAQQRG